MIAEYLEKISKLIGRPCLDKFLLEHGKKFRISRVKIKRGKMKMCYNNAYSMSFRDGLVYAEGYAISKGLPIPLLHAWCINKKGLVVDPTWNDGVEYFGVMLKTEYICKTMLRTERFGILDNWQEHWPILREPESEWKHDKR